MSDTFEAALIARTEAMLDACTRCGKCVEACPITTPAGVTAAPRAVIDGIIDILRASEGLDAARQWARACAASGECIKACEVGVNPRFLLAMARVAMAHSGDDAADRRRRGIENFRRVTRDVTHLARMQLDDALLQRLGQETSGDIKGQRARAEPPDFVFYIGCNVLQTPHIALLALDIMDALGIVYQVMGGPTHCCGVLQLRAGDVEIAGRVALAAVDKIAASGSGQVVSWCAGCHMQFTEVTLPTVERLRGARPFEMTPFMLFLGRNLDRLRPLLRKRVEMRVALHRHPSVVGVVEAAESILHAVPGVTLVELGQPAVGLAAALPAYQRELHRNELDAAQAAGIDALLTVYHFDHRHLCAHERDYEFRIMNVLEIVGESMGLRRDDGYKRFKMMQDVDTIAADCQELARQHRLNPQTTRQVIQAMLSDQPLPLPGRAS